MNIIRCWFFILIGLASTVLAAAYAVANPDTVLANAVVYGVIFLIIILPILSYLNVFRKLKNLFE